MESNDEVYIRLQKHLDNQPVGFPATQSGVELKILKHIFTPEEAEITTYLSYKLEPFKMIFDKVREPPKVIYGHNIKSNYHTQVGPKLSKHFK